MTTPRVLWLAFCALSLSCAGRRTRPTDSESSRDGSAIVLRGADLTSNLLDGLRHRIPAMTVTYPMGQCPRILFRGPRSGRNQGNPSVYVDGTLMRDTCVLTSIPVHDVDLVEVYPSGNSSRAVQRNPAGLILVFRVTR